MTFCSEGHLRLLLGSNVAYFDQRLGAAHSKHWLLSPLPLLLHAWQDFDAKNDKNETHVATLLLSIYIDGSSSVSLVIPQ